MVHPWIHQLHGFASKVFQPVTNRKVDEKMELKWAVRVAPTFGIVSGTLRIAEYPLNLGASLHHVCRGSYGGGAQKFWVQALTFIASVVVGGPHV